MAKKTPDQLDDEAIAIALTAAVRKNSEKLLLGLAAMGIPKHLAADGAMLCARLGRAKLLPHLLRQRSDWPKIPGMAAALNDAASLGNAAMVRSLLAAGLSLSPPDMVSPLFAAVLENSERGARALLDAGADIEAPCLSASHFAHGMTPLLAASRRNCTAAVELLIARGARLDATAPDGSTALIFAAANHGKCADQLIQAGADIHARNHAGFNAITIATSHRNAKLIRALAAAGADLKSTHPVDGRNLVELALPEQYRPELAPPSDAGLALIALGAPIPEFGKECSTEKSVPFEFAVKSWGYNDAFGPLLALSEAREIRSASTKTTAASKPRRAL